MIAAAVALLLGAWQADYIADNCARCAECCTDPEQVLEQELLEHAVSLGAAPALAEDLLHVERLAGVPLRLRGMLLAKAWRESRFDPRARGDRRGKVYKAHGLLQLWPWALRMIPDRDDPLASAHVFLGTLVSAVPKISTRCPGTRDRWRMAWIRVNRGPKWRRPDRAGQPRCSGTDPAGLITLRRWKRKIWQRLDGAD